MPLTASNTAAWTMAATRLITTGFVPATSPTRNIVWFQSTTLSAYAGEPINVTMTSARHPRRHTAVAVLSSAPPLRILTIVSPSSPTEAANRDENGHAGKRKSGKA
jgi:hypothetical protein